MPPSNAFLTGKALGVVVLSSTPPIHKLPLKRTAPLGKPSGFDKGSPSRIMLLLVKCKRKEIRCGLFLGSKRVMFKTLA